MALLTAFPVCILGSRRSVYWDWAVSGDKAPEQL